MNNRFKFITVVVLLLIIIFLLIRNNNNTSNEISSQKNNKKIENFAEQNNHKNEDISALTSEKNVVNYLKKNNKLPQFYITKKQARAKGWIASQGNICEVLPGKAIGGDVFTNRQKILPQKKNRIWYEADLNYNCGRRNADRVVFSNDGLIFVTYNHYKTFEQR